MDLRKLQSQNLQILQIFTENCFFRLRLPDFDDFYTIGSEFASRTRFHTPFLAVSAKNVVFENLYRQFVTNILRRIRVHVLRKSVNCF